MRNFVVPGVVPVKMKRTNIDRAPSISIGRLPVTGRDLFGRERELAWLDRCWAEGVRVASIRQRPQSFTVEEGGGQGLAFRVLGKSHGHRAVHHHRDGEMLHIAAILGGGGDLLGDFVIGGFFRAA